MTDLRLVCPALAAWATSAIVIVGLASIDVVDVRHTMAVRVMQLCLAALAFAAVVLRTYIGIGIAIVAAGLAGLAAASQISAWTSPMVEQFMGSQVEMLGVVNGPPRESLGVVYLPVSSREFSSDEYGAIAAEIPVSVTLPRFTAVPIPGTPVRVEGRLRPAGGSIHTAAYLQVEEAVEVTGTARLLDRAAQRVREALHDSLPASPAGGSALVAGLAIGDENAMSPELIEQMRMSGLSHLTAVSGGNVAIVIGAVLALAWVLRLPMVARISAALISLGFYVMVVHPEPSVLRAGVMGAVVVLSLLVGGRRPGPSVLATAVVVLVVVVPSLSVSWGFALSVAATAGIVMVAPILRHRIEQYTWGARIPAPVIVAATLTLAAQLATAPVLLAMGAYVGIAAVPANLLAMPVVPIVTVAGLAAALIELIPGFGAPAAFVAWVGAMAGEWIVQVAIRAAAIDFMRIRGSILVAGVFVCVVMVTFIIWRRGSPALRIATVAMVVIGTALWAIAPPDRRAWPPTGWVAVQCDVGQGDGLVIAPSGDAGAVVIDTGVSARVIDRCLEDLGVEHIAALVLTHFHADHVNGLAGVLDGRQVDAVFTTIAREPLAQAAGVLHELDRRGLQVQEVRAGSTFRVGSGEYRVIWPRRIITAGQISTGSLANNASIVLDVRVHGLRWLFTGDIEPPAQSAILGGLGGFDVVKIPHHGSAHQHPRFARWADSRVALISVGEDNGFGHPAPDTIAAWEAAGAQVLRTDLYGDVALLLDESRALAWVARKTPEGSP